MNVKRRTPHKFSFFYLEIVSRAVELSNCKKDTYNAKLPFFYAIKFFFLQSVLIKNTELFQ